MGYFSKTKTKECDQKNWSFSNDFGMLIATSGTNKHLVGVWKLQTSETYFQEVSAHILLKVATTNSFRDKKSMKIYLGHLSKAKTKECDQTDQSFCDKIGMLLALPDAFFLEVSAHVALKVATKDYFRHKQTMSFLGCFSKEKKEECDQKKQSFSDKFGILMAGSDIYFLEVSARISLKVTTKDYSRDKKNYANLAF